MILTNIELSIPETNSDINMDVIITRFIGLVLVFKNRKSTGIIAGLYLFQVFAKINQQAT